MGISARPAELTSYSTGWTFCPSEQELTAVVTYDHRLMTGCRDIGIATASPGRT